jgi:hypothetical protein
MAESNPRRAHLTLAPPRVQVRHVGVKAGCVLRLNPGGRLLEEVAFLVELTKR